MELKNYQQDVLNDLEKFMKQLDKDGKLNEAYRNYWLGKGIDVNAVNSDVLHPYDNSIKGVPRAMFKVPTAGGKTFIACNAIKTIFDNLGSDMPKVVTWFVPSDPILEQTLTNLKNPEHPYRQKINTLFNNNVSVIDKEEALNGLGLKWQEVTDGLTILVLSVQSFASNNKDGRRVYRENTNFADYAVRFKNQDDKINGADETSLIQAIAHLKPVVIIDESHNFEADLRLDLLNDICPRFILDLTATPRNKSNIISFVDAKKLKDANMVKLPVILYNTQSTQEVLLSAIQLRKKLEEMAKEEEKKGGRYIRPIVLLQAQPKNDVDSETFERIKKLLIDAGINGEEIKIKTAEKNELKSINLMSRDCEVRYIITVNALKEGWDCPFAYILASMANKTSSVDVTQILGRVLRLPYTRHNKMEHLNMSYVFTSSNNFRETVSNVISGLNNAGFSSKDYRVAEGDPEEEGGGEEPKEDKVNPKELRMQFEDADKMEDEVREKKEGGGDVETEIGNENAGMGGTGVDKVLQKALEQNQQYEEETKDKGDSEVPSDMKDKVKTYTIKDEFKEVAGKMKLPIFVQKIKTPTGIFPKDEVILTSKSLAEGFNLENEDSNIDFTRTHQDAVKIDLEKRREDEYVPKQYKMEGEEVSAVRELFVGYNVDAKKSQLTRKVAEWLKTKYDEVHEPHVTDYVTKVFGQKKDEELIDLFDNLPSTQYAIKNKIDELLMNHKKKLFVKWRDTGKIVTGEEYAFPKEMTLAKTDDTLSKGLYISEGDMNGFEYDVISQVASLDNVLFWHRNPERGKGFAINGYINHYPDFIVRMKSGKTILVETKGDDRDNSDSKNKIEMGLQWASAAGNNYRYYMVFNNATLDHSISVKELVERLKEL